MPDPTAPPRPTAGHPHPEPRPAPRPVGRRGPLALAALVALLVALVSCSASEAAGGSPPDGSPAGAQQATDTTAAVTTTTRPLRQLTVTASGDILLHSPVFNRARANAGGDGFDFRPMFDDVRDEISAADVAICHLETPLSPTSTRLSGYPIFNSPREIAPALADAGFDGCDTASNHTLDQGSTGVVATASVLDEAGLRHTGSFATAEAAVDGGGVIYETASGVRVGHLAYTYGTNGLVADTAWRINRNDPDTMLANARALKARGAEVVVMSVHWGAEYQSQPTGEQVTLAHRLLDSPDIDLILGDHVHVVQPMARYNGKYVIYGMGNFLSNQSPSSDASLIAATQDGALFTFTFAEQPAGGFVATGATYTPTYVRRPDYVIIKTSPSVQSDSFNRTVKAVNLLGPGSHDAEPTTGPVPPGLG